MSGSSASARASAARLIMPPDSEAGYLSAADRGKPARASFTAARCSASSRLSPACSISGSATFSVTVSDENNAPFWNSTPKRRSTIERSCSDRLGRFLPNTVTLPSLGWRRPTMLRSNTDLPLPEPPTTARISPLYRSRSRFSCTLCLPKRLHSPRTSITASVGARGKRLTSPSP
ncbi:hypothetical protein D3C71_1590720 [compost metagenome]